MQLAVPDCGNNGTQDEKTKDSAKHQGIQVSKIFINYDAISTIKPVIDSPNLNFTTFTTQVQICQLKKW
jgi:hypothetical protein